jgi:DNA gyrase subunit A
MSEGINQKSVPMELNYSGEDLEPVVLPSMFPNVLVNPNLGIAVGMSSTTVPHNLTEVCDALIAYIRGNGALTTVGLLSYIKGPDFPTGGTIMNGDDIAKIYTEGRGTIRVRSKYNVTMESGKPVITITEVPYLVSIEDKIIGKIKKMVVEDGYQHIENVQNITGNTGFGIKIICAKNANVNKVIKDLCENTGFQTNISINNTVLVNGVPKQITYLQMMQEFVSFRHKVLINIATYDKNKAETRTHIIDGLLVALADIDNVIQIIKNSANKDSARQALIAKYAFDIEQTNAILDMRLSKLTNLETVDLQTEKGELLKEIEKQTNIINNVGGARDTMLINQFIAIKTKYGDMRKTAINSVKENLENVEPKDTLHLVLKNGDMLVIEPEDKIQLNKKGSQWSKCVVEFGYKTKNVNSSYLFGKSGKIYKVDNLTLDINAINPLALGDSLACGLDAADRDAQYLITVTKKGVIKKSAIAEYDKISRTTQAVKVREDDELVAAHWATDDDYLLLLGKKGGVVKVAVKDINTSGRATIGSKGIDDEVISSTVGDSDTLIFTLADGKAKFTQCCDFNITAKGGKGQTVGDNTTHICAVKDAVWVAEKGVKFIKYGIASLAVKGKTAAGAKITDEKLVILVN